MLGNFQPHSVEYLRFLPEILPTLFGIVIMLLEAVSSGGSKRHIGGISLIGIAAAFGANFWAYTQHGSAFQDMIINDGPPETDDVLGATGAPGTRTRRRTPRGRQP